MSRGQLVYLSLMPGGKVRVIRCGFDHLILCGNDGMKMYVIAQRVWRQRGRKRKEEREGQGQTLWNTSTSPAGTRRASWRQGQNNQKYTRNMLSEVLQDPKYQSLKKRGAIKPTGEMRLRSFLDYNVN